MRCRVEIINRATLRLEVRGRTVTVRGEAFVLGESTAETQKLAQSFNEEVYKRTGRKIEVIPDPAPDFEVCSGSIKTWDDGQPVTESEKQEIIQTIVEEAKRKGWKIEIV